MIDIKTLRINSTVLCDGVRAKVVDLQTCHFGSKTAPHVRVKGISPYTGEEKVVGGMTDGNYIAPIPITEELLKELGFEESTDNIIGVPIFAKTIDNDFHIEVKKFHGYDEWRFHVDDCDRDSVGSLDLHYLHEAEAFVYLTTKQELI